MWTKQQETPYVSLTNKFLTQVRIKGRTEEYTSFPIFLMAIFIVFKRFEICRYTLKYHHTYILNNLQTIDKFEISFQRNIPKSLLKILLKNHLLLTDHSSIPCGKNEEC